MSELLGVLFLALFVVAAALCIYLSITMSRRVQAGIVRWRTEERQALEAELRNLAEFDARLRFEQWKNEHEQEIRQDAVQRSLVVSRGKLTEHIVPYLPGFDLDPKDVRFLGTPIDLIAFSGLNASQEVEIVFIEVKTGQSVLSARERAVKKAVEEKRVSWRVINPDVEVILGILWRVCNPDWRRRCATGGSTRIKPTATRWRADICGRRNEAPAEHENPSMSR